MSYPGHILSLAVLWAKSLKACGGCLGCNGRFHRLEVGSCPPSSISIGPSKMRHRAASNVTEYPASQNFAVDRSNACARPGTMCAWVAVGQSHGMSTLHVCVDLICLLSGSVMEIGCAAICLLMMCAPSAMKWLVVPELLRADVASGACGLSLGRLWVSLS